jgi:DNA-binding transcriptional ArsR family regulator
LVIALEQSLIGGADRTSYGEQARVSPATASTDLRRLLDADLVEQRGRGRNIRYHASDRLRSVIAGEVTAVGDQSGAGGVDEARVGAGT